MGLSGDQVRLVQKGGKTLVIDKGGALEALNYCIAERAAIMEYDGGMNRKEAEAAASALYMS